MINPTELRIGNCITSKEWKGYHIISGIEITETGFELLINGFVHKYEPGKYFDIEPILLTEEIVSLKAGFEHVGMYWHKDGFYIFQSENLNFYFEYNDTQIVIESVHQLQNMYYWLNDKTELNITL